jgi:hypothetical protein
MMKMSSPRVDVVIARERRERDRDRQTAENQRSNPRTQFA